MPAAKATLNRARPEAGIQPTNTTMHGKHIMQESKPDLCYHMQQKIRYAICGANTAKTE